MRGSDVQLVPLPDPCRQLEHCCFPGLALVWLLLRTQRHQGRGEMRLSPWGLPGGRGIYEALECLSSQNKGADFISTLVGFSQNTWWAGA